jgi:hypothetical protein
MYRKNKILFQKERQPTVWTDGPQRLLKTGGRLGVPHGAISAVLRRIAYGIGARQMKVFSHIAIKRDANTIGVAFMSKKEIPADRSTAGVARCKFTQRQVSSVKDNVP